MNPIFLVTLGPRIFLVWPGLAGVVDLVRLSGIKILGAAFVRKLAPNAKFNNPGGDSSMKANMTSQSRKQKIVFTEKWRQPLLKLMFLGSLLFFLWGRLAEVVCDKLN